MEKLKTLLWFLARPALYSQLIYLVRLRLNPHPKENTRKEAEEWCKSNSIGVKELLVKLFGLNKAQLEDPSAIYPEIFEKAREIEASLPVQMGYGGDINLIFSVARALRATKVVETGVAYGWSSLATLLAFNNNEDANLISTDMPYPKMNNEKYVGCVVPEELKKNWKLIRKPDRQGLPLALRELKSIDLCHYDSDKTFVGRKWAYPLLWKCLRKGGIFISDDIGDNIAFKEFCEDIDQEGYIMRFGNKYIGLIVKSE